jgi:hypothetical protein
MNWDPAFNNVVHSKYTTLDCAMFLCVLTTLLMRIIAYLTITFNCRLLLPICLEKARSRFLIMHANRHCLLTQTGPLNFELTFENVKSQHLNCNEDDSDDNLTREDRIALSSLIGGKVKVTASDRLGTKKSEELFIVDFVEDTLTLTCPTPSDFTKQDVFQEIGPSMDSVIYRAENLRVEAHFHVSKLDFKIAETGVIDAMTACGLKWFGNEGEAFQSLPSRFLQNTTSHNPLTNYYQEQPTKSARTTRKTRPLVITFTF